MKDEEDISELGAHLPTFILDFILPPSSFILFL